MHRVTLFGLSVLAICVSAITMVQAQPIPTGQLSLFDRGPIEVLAPGGLPNGNLNTGNLFTLQPGATGATGIFATLPSFGFRPISFNKDFCCFRLTDADGLFGTFFSTTPTLIAKLPGLLDLFFVGEWTPSAHLEVFEGVPPGPFPASLRLTLTQSPAFTGRVSAIGTLSVPPASQPPVIPEPSTIVMFLTGLPGAVAMYLRRRRCRLAAV